MWKDIEQAISEASGTAFRIQSRSEIGGGCINRAFCLRGADRSCFLKLNTAHRLPMFESEAAGLAEIAATQTLRVPEPLAWGTVADQSWLALEYIPFAKPGATTAALLGERLAAMHRATNDQFGWQQDNVIGSTPQPNGWADDWLSFLRDRRLGFQFEQAARNDAPATLLDKGWRLLTDLPDLLGSYRPRPSLLHGDLWGGNWAADEHEQPVIFDPAVYFGDRETDLAMTELFGGFSDGFYSAYRAVWPLEQGYEVRKRVYNLYHILNHFNLFGGGYAGQAERTVDFLLAQ